MLHEHGWRSQSLAPSLLTSALDGGEWLASRSGRLIPGERVPTRIGWEAGCAQE
jgi:hypothetical protein